MILTQELLIIEVWFVCGFIFNEIANQLIKLRKK